MFGAMKNLGSVGGVIRHCYFWVTSSANDKIISNPKADANIDKNDQVAIFCVHGTVDRTNAFKLVAERLIDKLPVKISAMHLVAFEQRARGVGIEIFANQLKDKILSSGYKKVILMGHSRGGLVCSYFSEYLAETAGISVESVFAISSPFGGSDKAIMPLRWMSTSVDQMSLQSEFLSDLNVRIKQSLVPYHYYASDKDILVNVDSSYVAGGEQRLTILRGHNHLSIMSSWKLVGHMLQHIVGENSLLSLDTLHNDLVTYIDDFKKTSHVKSAQTKLSLLEKLDELVQDMISHPGVNRYPEATSIGEFIQTFLDDKSFLPNGVSVMSVINTPLNTYIQFSNTATADFLLGLKLRYKHVDLAVQSEELTHSSSETQTLSQSV